MQFSRTDSWFDCVGIVLLLFMRRALTVVDMGTHSLRRSLWSRDVGRLTLMISRLRASALDACVAESDF